MTPSSATPRDDLARAVACSRLFRGLDPGFLATLTPHASVHRLEQGEHLWREGQRAEHFHVVLRGVLELQRAACAPDTSLVALFGPGESPAIPVTLEQKPYIATSCAATPTVEVLRVASAPILRALPSDPALAMAMNRALLDHCRLLHAKVDVLSAGIVPRRLARLMLDLVDRFGDEDLDGRHFVPLALSRAQLATYVGARVETVIRVCSAWQRAGLLTTSREGFAISSIAVLRDVLRGDGEALRAAGGCGPGSD